MTSIFAIRRKREAVKEAESQGIVSDSMEVRMELVRKFQAGEISGEEMQKTLKNIKRTGKKLGLMTRDEVYRRG